MNNKSIGIGMIFVMIVMFWVSVMWSAAQQPPKPPADLSQVRMHFTAGKLTLYAPADKVAMRPGIDKNITVIEVDTTPPIVPVQ